jgi:uncharacterized ferredoxin-like protein
MNGQHPDQDAIAADAVRQVATLMAAAAITAPKSGGQLFLAGKPNPLQTVIVTDPDTRRDLAGWMRARGKERRETIWFRDAEVAETVQAILFIGLAPNWYPPNYDCGACGYATVGSVRPCFRAQRAAVPVFAGPQSVCWRERAVASCGSLADFSRTPADKLRTDSRSIQA